MSNKRGAEWPTFLIKSIFSLLLFIVGIMIIIGVVKSGDINFKNDLNYLKFQTETARLLNSASCWAWEENTPSGYLVHAGVIDLSKLDNINGCLSGVDYSYEIKYTAPDGIKTVTMSRGSGMTYSDLFGIKVVLNGNMYDGIASIATK